MEYLVDGGRYDLNYAFLREDYFRYKNMRDEEFLASLIKVLHFTCVVCYLKQESGQVLLSDKDLIHQIVHLLQEDTKEDALRELRDIRNLFDSVCALA
jgi:hypothetical protein